MRQSRSLPEARFSLSFSEGLLAVCALVLGAAMSWYVYAFGLMKALTDQSSHLNFARLTFDSMTPGISQLGFWPPLLHVLLMPFVAVPFLYDSGFAGAMVLIPCLMLSTVLLYRITLRLSNNNVLAIAAAAVFLLNPYVLYYSTTPMMEMLFITNLFLATYLLLRWIETDSLLYLLGTGIAISLACLSRFEGFMIIPMVSIIVLLRTFRQRIGKKQIEAIFLMFGLLAALGIVFIVTYSWVYGGNPLAFAGGDWLRDPAAALRPAHLNLGTTLQDILAASSYMLGEPLVILSAISFLLLPLFRSRSFERFAALLTLSSPLLFVLVALFLGSITINVPELPPYAIFNNDRYGLTWIGFSVLAPLLLLHELDRKAVRSKLMSFLLRPVSVLVLVVLAVNSFRFYDIVFAENFNVIRENINSPAPEQIQIADYLHDHYAGGKILSARVDNDPIFATAGVPLNQYLYEGNFRYFDQAVKEPWFFAKWVIMHNPAGSNDGWVQQNEPVYRVLGTSEEFKKYYDLVVENDKRRLFRLNENHVLQLVKERGYDPARIPSLNTDIQSWDPSTIYAQMSVPGSDRLPAAQLVQSKATVKSELLDYYWNHLKPDFTASGSFVNQSGRGNSESQSYALLQALAVDDPQTFDTVWQATKRELQQPDGLFAWNFSILSGNTVRIDDKNSATDADTDIAYALLLAAQRWSRPQYLVDVKPILLGIWGEETVEVDGKRHVIAGNWAHSNDILAIDPSYFAPAAYRLFAQADPTHDWLSLIPTGYEDLAGASALMQAHGQPYLPPDWVQYNLTTHSYEPFAAKPGSLQFSFDAFRVFWRIAQDAIDSHDTHAAQYMQAVKIFDDEWQNRDRLCSLYLATSNTPGTSCYLDLGTMAGAVSFWTMQQPRQAQTILQTFALAPGEVRLPAGASFYQKSWFWFMLWQWTGGQQEQDAT